ncbi:MAG: hypothetical protein RLZ47_1082 [Bacteroidota bacterium]
MDFVFIDFPERPICKYDYATKNPSNKSEGFFLIFILVKEKVIFGGIIGPNFFDIFIRLAIIF